MRALRERVFQHLQRRLHGVPLRIVLWDGERFEFSDMPLITVTLHSRRLGRLLLTGNMAGLGAAYVSGELGVEGEAEDILEVGIALAERVGHAPVLRHIGPLIGKLRRHSKKRDAADVRYHYDVSNEFYRLWLDRHMVYSCAYFKTGAEDLDTAQEQKLDHLCRKLRLQPGERLLDIGCGWGGLACWAAARYGVTAVGVTLSELQVEEARRRVADAALADRVEIRCQDYRDVSDTGGFDKIVSVGMYEHVGIANLPLYFQTIARLLKPGGMALNHGITAGDRDGAAQGPPGGEFIDRFVFPGGALPHLSKVIYEIAGAGLEVLDVEDLRPHYPPTLWHWVKRLEGQRDAAVAAAGPERYRIWRLYMPGMAYAFERGFLSVAQVLAVKPLKDGPAGRPWTRDYQYAPPAPSRLPAR
ncbi:MAG: class I SAM-dependent methyltransferase [Alphaproteobacteria bacterium]|nr:class I SAM-dependent methyltransferase [Alphaproteobacteria bacterium]